MAPHIYYQCNYHNVFLANRLSVLVALAVVRCTYENEKVDVDIPSQSGSNLLQSYSIDKCVLVECLLSLTSERRIFGTKDWFKYYTLYIHVHYRFHVEGGQSAFERYPPCRGKQLTCSNNILNRMGEFNEVYDILSNQTKICLANCEDQVGN